MARNGEKFRGAKSCGKDASWKSQKPDFPTSLGNPANTRGIPTFPQLRLLLFARRRVIEEMGTFLFWQRWGHFYFGMTFFPDVLDNVERLSAD